MKLGDTVFYILTPEDVKEINSRRTDERTVRYYRVRDRWPQGIQTHVGNQVHTGDICAATVVRANSETSANLQVALDGSDCLWVQNVEFSEKGNVGTWILPPIEDEEEIEDKEDQTKTKRNKK